MNFKNELKEILSDENIRKNWDYELKAGSTVKDVRKNILYDLLRDIFEVAKEYNFKSTDSIDRFISQPIADREKIVKKIWLEMLGFNTDEAEAFDNNRRLQQTIKDVNKVVSSVTNGTSTVENIDDLNDFIYKAAIPLWINAMQCKSVFQPQIEIPSLNNKSDEIPIEYSDDIVKLITNKCNGRTL
jgi:hypothetical protein